MAHTTSRMSREISNERDILTKRMTKLAGRLKSIVACRIGSPRDDAGIRVGLAPLKDEQPAIVIDLHGRALLGHTNPAVNIDLAVWNAKALGVSRRHALLECVRGRLYVIDQKSTNGTCKNGLHLASRSAFEVKDGDILSLGMLHFGLVIRPVPDALTHQKAAINA